MQTSDERDLRDIEQHVTFYRKRQRQARKFGDVVSHLLARRGYAQIQSGEEIRRAWLQVVGASLAGASQPARLRRGVLRVVVQNSSAMQELTFQKGKLLQQLRQLLAAEKIRDLRFEIGPLGS